VPNGIKVELTIRDNKTGKYLKIPVTPPTIKYNDGEALVNSVNILNLGTVDFANGVDLDSMGWDSFFPARYDAGYCSTSDLLTPTEYRDQFVAWKNEHISLQVICPAAGINKQMYVRQFQGELKGFEGDIYYTVNFTEDRKLLPRQIDVAVTGTTIQAVTTVTPESRPEVAQEATPATYTVVAGDSLSLIGKKLGIAWVDIYNRNKGIIGPDPNKIYPGQVFSV